MRNLDFSAFSQDAGFSKDLEKAGEGPGLSVDDPWRQGQANASGSAGRRHRGKDSTHMLRIALSNSPAPLHPKDNRFKQKQARWTLTVATEQGDKPFYLPGHAGSVQMSWEGEV